MRNKIWSDTNAKNLYVEMGYMNNKIFKIWAHEIKQKENTSNIWPNVIKKQKNKMTFYTIKIS